MSSIRITLPDTYLFSTDLPVRITDLNYGNHLGNDAFVSFVHEARVRWLQKHGWTELSVGGLGLIMVDLAVRFKAEALYGDTLRIELAVQDWTRCGFTLVYRASNADTGKEIARATTGMVFFDYEKKAIQEIPDWFRARVCTKPT
jgi:acyl-CoA thioesterase FadM